jgi:murein DD-endopeptidase MepM/ murein hydrolase activator NlpD
MEWVKILMSLVAAVVILSLAACLGVETTISPRPVENEISTPHRPQAALPAATTATTPTRMATVSLPDPTPLPTQAALFQPCSPLVDTPIRELPEIVSDPYHPPPMGKDERHQGVDFSYYRRGERMSIQGAGIQAIFAGRVAAAIPDSFPFGNHIIIETPGSDLPLEIRQQFGIQDGESLYTLYAHMQSPPEFELGQAVQACQLIGQVGKSGNAGVAHLHLEMRHGAAGTQFPSMGFYKLDDTPEERANYQLWATSGNFLHFDPLKLLLSQD